MHSPEDHTPQPLEPGHLTDATDAARRDALRKLAALGAWTAPVILTTLLVSPRASAESGPPPCPEPPCN